MQQLIGRFDQTFSISLKVATAIDDFSKTLEDLAQVDFGAWAQAGADGLAKMLQIVIVLGATRIPALAGAVMVWVRATWAAHAANVAAAASTMAMNAQMMAGIVAARGLSGAMALVASAGRSLVMLAGGPFAVLAGVVAGVVVQYQSADANARDLAASTRDLATNQKDLPLTTTIRSPRQVRFCIRGTPPLLAPRHAGNAFPRGAFRDGLRGGL